MAGTGVAVASGELTPLLDDNGSGVYIKGRNSQRDIRVGLLGLSFLVGSDGFTPRPGVLVRSSDQSDLKAVSQVTPNNSVTMKKGAAILPRVGQGSYLFVNEVDQIVTLPAASAVNPRYDIICLAAFDKGSFVSDTAHGPQFWVESGVVSGTPAVPSTPTGMLKVAEVLRAVNDNTIGTENVDKRVSTSLHTGFRTILPGETAADAGLYIGEGRYTALALGPEVWTGAAWAPIGSTVIGGKRYVTGGNLSTCSGSEVLGGVDTGAIAYRGGRNYEIEIGFSATQTNGPDEYLAQIKDTNLAGAGFGVGIVPNFASSAVPLWHSLRFQYKPVADITKTFVLSITRATGSGSMSITASSTGATYAKATLTGLSGSTTDV